MLVALALKSESQKPKYCVILQYFHESQVKPTNLCS